MNYTYRNIWLINFPVMMSILIEQLINITDAIFLGHIGEIELGASALAGIWYLAIYMLGFGFSLGLQVVIARRNGERNYPETGKTFFQGLLFLSGLAILLCTVSKIFSPIVLGRLIASEEVYAAVIDYLDWRIWGFHSHFLHCALSLSVPHLRNLLTRPHLPPYWSIYLATGSSYFILTWVLPVQQWHRLLPNYAHWQYCQSIFYGK